MTITKTLVLDIDAGKADEALQQVKDGLDNVADSVDDVSEAADESVKATGGMAKGFKGVGTAVKGVGVAMKAAGIGLIVALFAKLAEVVGKNQKVMDIFSNVMTTLEIAFKDLFSFVTENFMPALDRVKTFFDNLTFDKIKKAIKENLIERFESVIEVIGFLKKAFKQLLDRDWQGAMDSAKEAGKEMIDVYTGVDDTLGKVKETITKTATAIKNYATETYKAADAMTQLNNQALLAESVNKGLIEQYDRQAEQLRQIRDDDTKGIEERIEANKRLAAVLNEQEKLMLGNADLAIQAAKNQVALNNNIENQVALQDALNERAGIQAQIEGFRSEQLVNQNSLLRERSEIEKAYYDEIEAMMVADLDEHDKATNKKTTDEINAGSESLNNAKAVEDAKSQLVGQTSALIGAIIKKDSITGKAVAVAQATMNTYQGVTAALAQTTDPTPGQFLRFANAAAVGVMGLLNVKNIVSTKTAGGGGGGGSVAAPSAPSFNLVAGTGTNQIAEGLNNEAPIAKAYVVSSDVSSSQELDRKIIEGASL